MHIPSAEPVILPTAEQIRRAVSSYIQHAYDGQPTETARRLIPPEGFDPKEWLMAELVERDPANAPLANVRSFALRLGNMIYPHMKLRLSRPPHDSVFIFSVDSHDAFLSAPPDSRDYAALEEMKRYNAVIVAAVTAAWDAAGLLTERNYLRQKIQEARERGL